MVTYEHPQKIREGGPLEATTYIHPAYAHISANRVSVGGGGQNLFGSDFQHGHFITISISTAQLNRTLSRDWTHERNELIEVALSEAQWAAFVSSLNNGGTACTLQRHNGKLVPQIPKQEPRTQQFSNEMKDTMREIQEGISEVINKLTEGNLGKTKVKELHRELDMLRARLTSSTSFVAKQFDQHMENTVEHAKTEVNAYITGTIHRAGLEALAGDFNLRLTDDQQGERS